MGFKVLSSGLTDNPENLNLLFTLKNVYLLKKLCLFIDIYQMLHLSNVFYEKIKNKFCLNSVIIFFNVFNNLRLLSIFLSSYIYIYKQR